jgi:phosphonopyruvate decarboxylase
MADPQSILMALEGQSFDFFVGVPDSTLAGIINLLSTRDQISHIIATSEGEAVAIAAGYHLAVQKTPVVYMQNDGLGNAVNPLTSLADSRVYDIPMLFLIGWRGCPGDRDAIQHKKMGLVLPGLLNILNIDYEIFNEDTYQEQIKIIKAYIDKEQKPFALLFRRGQLDKIVATIESTVILSRERAIEVLSQYLKKDYFFISTTGKTSRELYEIRQKYNEDTGCDFYIIGSMGFASSLGLGVALNTAKQVVILDGDGALLMHMGNMATIGYYQPPNLIHVLLNNGSYESTGSQPTVAHNINFVDIAKACGYKDFLCFQHEEDLTTALKSIHLYQRPLFIEIKTNTYSRPDLRRINLSVQDIKYNFIQNIK